MAWYDDIVGAVGDAWDAGTEFVGDAWNAGTDLAGDAWSALGSTSDSLLGATGDFARFDRGQGALPLSLIHI